MDRFGGVRFAATARETVAPNSQMPDKNRIGQKILLFKTIKNPTKKFTQILH